MCNHKGNNAAVYRQFLTEILFSDQSKYESVLSNEYNILCLIDMFSGEPLSFFTTNNSWFPYWKAPYSGKENRKYATINPSLFIHPATRLIFIQTFLFI